MTHIESTLTPSASLEAASATRSLRQQRAAAPSTDGGASRSDRVEISSAAAAISQSADSGFRPDLVKRIREQIESGTYDIESRLDLTAERLSRDLGF